MSFARQHRNCPILQRGIQAQEGVNLPGSPIQHTLDTADSSPMLTQTGRWYIGGVREDEIDSLDSDADIPEMRFKRGQFSMESD